MSFTSACLAPASTRKFKPLLLLSSASICDSGLREAIATIASVPCGRGHPEGLSALLAVANLENRARRQLLPDQPLPRHEVHGGPVGLQVDDIKERGKTRRGYAEAEHVAELDLVDAAVHGNARPRRGDQRLVERLQRLADRPGTKPATCETRRVAILCAQRCEFGLAADEAVIAAARAG